MAITAFVGVMNSRVTTETHSMQSAIEICKKAKAIARHSHVPTSMASISDVEETALIRYQASVTPHIVLGQNGIAAQSARYIVKTMMF
jgi:hypothetical protein